MTSSETWIWDIPKANSDVACIHAVLSVVFLDFVQVLDYVSKGDRYARETETESYQNQGS